MPHDAAVLRERIEGRAIWNEYRFDDHVLISDAFIAALEVMDAIGWDLTGKESSIGTRFKEI